MFFAFVATRAANANQLLLASRAPAGIHGMRQILRQNPRDVDAAAPKNLGDVNEWRTIFMRGWCIHDDECGVRDIKSEDFAVLFFYCYSPSVYRRQDRETNFV